MAYTMMEVKEATDAVLESVTKDDLFKLGLIYSTDVEDRGPDYVEAHKWFSLAALMGSSPAKAYRDEIKMEMSAEDLTLAQKAARGWMLEHRDAMMSA